MHIQISALLCHFNWLKSFNWQQRGEDGGAFLRRSGLAWESRQSVCHAKHLSGFVYQACSGVSTLWLLMWQLHSGFQFSGHVVLERKQEDGTQLIWLPMMYITHPRPTSRARQPSEKERMLDICKQGLTDTAADDLWGSAEDPCHMHATELKDIRVKAGTQGDTGGQIASPTTPDDQL